MNGYAGQIGAKEVLAKGWGELHPLNDDFSERTRMMIYAPRNDSELDAVKRVTHAAYLLTVAEPTR